MIFENRMSCHHSEDNFALTIFFLLTAAESDESESSHFKSHIAM